MTGKIISLHPSQTPATLGYRMPAEWEPHAATWIGWPHNAGDWPGKLAAIHWVYGEIVRKLTPGENVRILVNSAVHEKQARRILKRVGVDFSRVEFFQIPTNRGWTRDFGPIFVTDPAGRRPPAIVRFKFNAWAKYPDWQLDNQVVESAAGMLGIPCFQAKYKKREVVLEGGSIDSNGQGAILTTEECLLDPVVQVRNPGLTKTDLEIVIHDYLGAEQVLWLNKGIQGDDTHGHIDDVCRFVKPDTVVLCEEPDSQDENHAILKENAECLQDVRLANGAKLQVVPLPMPHPLYLDNQRLPASYANFYIANAAVLVPTFNDPRDRLALGILAELFPDREVVGIHAVDLVWGLGTLHCLTQQQPR